MALGDNYNNQNETKEYRPTVYSPFRMYNAENSVDPSALNFTFWNNTLKISIAPRKDGNGDNVSFDYKNEIAIYLNHTKAKILYDEICRFQEDPIKFNSSGLPSGQGLITISNGKEYGQDCPCLVIRKVDEEGNTTTSFAYFFKTGYHYAIRNFDEKNNSFDKVTADYDNLEIEQLKTILIEYYKAMTGAIAYSIIDANRFESGRLSGKIDQIANKLGVQFNSSNKSGSYKSSTSAFNSRPATNYTSSSYDDISREMDEND